MVYFCARTSQLLLGAVLFLLRDGWALPVLFFFPDTVTPTGPTDGVPHPPLYVMIPIENLFDLLLHGWPLEYHPCVSRIAIGSTSVVSRPWRWDMRTSLRQIQILDRPILPNAEGPCCTQTQTSLRLEAAT